MVCTLYVLSTIRLVKVHLLLKKWTTSYAALFLDCAQRCVLVNKILTKLIFLYRFIVYFLILPPDIDSRLWQYKLWSFQMGGTTLERFLPKNQHPQRNLLNFENWINGDLRSFQKSELLTCTSMGKIICMSDNMI